MFVDFVLNGEGHGPVAEQMAACRFDPGMQRPYLDPKTGQKCVTLNTGRMEYNKEKKIMEPVYQKVRVADLVANGQYNPVFNGTSLRKDEWEQMDRAVHKAVRQRLSAWADLAAASTYGGFNGMSKMILEHETMSDPGAAVVDMDGLSEGKTDSPLYQREGLPLPLTHSDFFFSERRLAVSRNSGTPLDMTMAEAAARRVAETIEKTTIGTLAGEIYGVAANYGRTPQVTGYTNFPGRTTKTDLTTPTGTNPEAIVSDILEMVELAQTAGFNGPYMLYHSTGYSRYLNDDYYRSGSTSAVRTVRERIMEIEGISDVRRLNYLTSGYQLLLIQLDSEVARAVIGMPVTTVQWESKGGMQKNFKVMCIMVPDIKEDYYGNCGIVHGTTA